MKLLHLFLALTFFVGTLAHADELEDPILHYQNDHIKKICGISENWNGGTIDILLHDGTLWHCFYEFMSDRHTVFTRWHEGMKLHFRGISSKYEYTFRVIGFTNKHSSFAELYTNLDIHSYDLLPTITEISDEGYIVLSDGSVWTEFYRMYSGMQYWQIGERVFVSHDNDYYYKLFNIDQPQGLFFNSICCTGKLVRLND